MRLQGLGAQHVPLHKGRLGLVLIGEARQDDHGLLRIVGCAKDHLGVHVAVGVLVVLVHHGDDVVGHQISRSHVRREHQQGLRLALQGEVVQDGLVRRHMLADAGNLRLHGLGEFHQPQPEVILDLLAPLVIPPAHAVDVAGILGEGRRRRLVIFLIAPEPAAAGSDAVRQHMEADGLLAQLRPVLHRDVPFDLAQGLHPAAVGVPDVLAPALGDAQHHHDQLADVVFHVQAHGGGHRLGGRAGQLQAHGLGHVQVIDIPAADEVGDLLLGGQVIVTGRAVLALPDEPVHAVQQGDGFLVRLQGLDQAVLGGQHFRHAILRHGGGHIGVIVVDEGLRRCCGAQQHRHQQPGNQALHSNPPYYLNQISATSCLSAASSTQNSANPYSSTVCSPARIRSAFHS